MSCVSMCGIVTAHFNAYLLKMGIVGANDFVKHDFKHRKVLK
ncbi:MAG: hypothetical protein UT61_C0064G0003 [Candidatus Woesebacteria bacterium GW2011_GWA1_39_8]|uniref:Uncharacterized protein n=1 Tax=Candidatus Woesebacteria bacterium GW2011_GWA1_39_8 TaxID=1618552 RepID=A0A0G0PIU8_9BACT|nr:MAG: hypothetical protein UT61_C0064G0003 [Candidatus Woesebacteria bacterium GW2011_GWA1_39_8]